MKNLICAILEKEIPKDPLDAGYIYFNKETLLIMEQHQQLKLTNNWMEYILQEVKSLENRGILLKATNRKVLNQKRGFLGNVLGPLIKAGLQLMKNVLTP